MKVIIVYASIVLSTITAVFSQTAHISGAVQTTSLGEQKGVAVAITGTTFDGISPLPITIDTLVYTDDDGKFTFSYPLFPNPLYTVIPDELPYNDLILSFTYSKEDYVDKYIDGLFINEQPYYLPTVVLPLKGENLYKPSIAMVTYDTVGTKILVVWEEEDDEEIIIESYVLYKLQAHEWKEVATLTKGNILVYEDEDISSSEKAIYQLQALLDGGKRSDFSEPKSPPDIFLTIDNGIPSVNWSAVSELFKLDLERIDKIQLSRSTLPGGRYELVKEIDISGKSETELEDLLTIVDNTLQTAGTYYYRISHYYKSWIDPTPRDLKVESGPFILAMSNIAEAKNVTVAIQRVEYAKLQISIDNGHVRLANKYPEEYAVYGVDGVLFEKGTLQPHESFVLPRGVYIITCGGASTKIFVD